MTVFFFTQWYPNKYDAMEGLFVRKHAEAIARQGNEVHVFYVHIQEGQTTREYYLNDDHSGVIEHIEYLPAGTNVFKEMSDFKKLVRRIIKSGVEPDIIHINVLGVKNGLCAHTFSKQYNVPFVITEHWSGYLPTNGTFNSRNRLQKYIHRRIAKHAACIMPVSQLLQQAMQGCKLQCRRWEIVPNVVDDFFYSTSPQEKKDTTTKHQLLHVSCFDNKAKNIKGIVRAIDRLSKIRQDFHLSILGTGQDYDDTLIYAHKLGLTSDYISFHGEKTPQEVKAYMDESDIFVLFSNYETAAVVLQEAMACGLPVVTTDVGIAISEIEHSMGEKVEIGNTDDLIEKLNRAMDRVDTYDIENMRQQAKKYTYANVGKQIHSIYLDTKKEDN